jgi:peptidoglycan-associated lipoprotein
MTLNRMTTSRPQAFGATVLLTSLLLAGCAGTKAVEPPRGGIGGTTPASANSEAASTSSPAPAPAPAPSRYDSAPVVANTLPNASGAQSTAPVSPYATLVEAGDRILFLTDRYDLTDEARAILSRQAIWIMANPSKRVLIAGNCDERGTREYNLALGARRASAARDFLLSLGVDAGKVETVSYGKERPVDARPSVDGWAVNRNAQTKLLD